MVKSEKQQKLEQTRTNKKEEVAKKNNCESSKDKSLENKIAELEDKLKETQKQYLYKLADLENTKKRLIKESFENLKYSISNFLLDFLIVIDDLERLYACLNLEQKKGFDMILKNIDKVFEKHNIKVVGKVGEKFDPNIHEAIAKKKGKKGIILEVFRKGYILHDRLIRPAQVVVGVGNDKENENKKQGR